MQHQAILNSKRILSYYFVAHSLILTSPEPQRVLRLRFTDNKLSRIEDLVNVKAVDEFRLAPKLIAMLESDNEDRLAIPLQQYPRLLIDALLLTEDRRFMSITGLIQWVFVASNDCQY